MHKLLVLIFPRFSTDPLTNEKLMEISVKVYLYKKDISSISGWQLITAHTSDYKKTTGKVLVGTKISISGGIDNPSFCLFPVNIHINLKEWLEYYQFSQIDQLSTEIALLLNAKSTELGTCLDVERITFDDRVNVTVAHT